MVDATTGPAPVVVPSARRNDLVWVALGAITLRLPAILSSRHLSFDDGVYGATAVAMRDGARPYRDVFSSQGPLHLPLVFLADLVGLRTLDAPRLLALASAVVITVGTYLLGCRFAGRRGGLVAAGLATSAGSVLLVTTGISGDGPAIAFALAALVGAFAYRDHPSTGRAILVGLLVGGALAVKLLAAPVVVPVALVLWSAHRGTGTRHDGRRRFAHLLAAVLAALAVPLLLAAPWGYERVWDQSVAYHREARRYTVGEAAWRIVRTLVERDSLVVMTALLGATSALRLRRVPRDRRVTLGDRLARPPAVLGLWLGAQVAALLLESAMWRPHVSQLVVPMSLLAVLHLPPWRTVVLGWLVATPVVVIGVSGIVRPGGYRGDDAALARRLRALPSSAVVVGDDPGFAWRTGNRVPEELVDTSVKQFDQGRITQADVLRAARARHTCAVLIASGERLGRYPRLPDQLEADGYSVVWRDGERRLLLRPCR